MLGLTLALRLAKRGEEVTLFEAADDIGGLADAWSLDGVVWDRHYHVILLSDLHLRNLLTELGLEREIVWTETRTGFYANGQLYPLSNAIDYLRLPVVNLVDKSRLAATIVYASRVKNWKALEAVSAVDWLGRLSGPRVLERVWIPLLKAKLGESYGSASAAFIWAIISRLYAARRSGLKKEMFGYVRGGYSRILVEFRKTLEKAGVSVVTQHRLTSASRVADGRIALSFQNGTTAEFDRVVGTMAPGLASRLIPELKPEERSKLEQISYQGIICAAMLLKKPLAGYYLTYITDRVPFTAVIEMSALTGQEPFHGKSLVYLPKYVSPDDPLFGAPDDEIEPLFRAGFHKMYPAVRREDVICFRVSRVRQVFPISTLHYSNQVSPAITSIPGLYLVNSSQIINGTLNVNETVQLAERTVTSLL